MEDCTALRSEKDKAGVESNGIILCMEQKGRDAEPNKDLMYPYIILSLNLGGTSHCKYDMKDIRAEKNDLTVFLPGHIIRPLEHSEDYTQAWLLLNPAKFEDSELKFSSADIEHLYQSPLCHLSDEQAQTLLTILRAINYILSRSEEELPNKHHLLKMQLTVAYELYLSIRHEQDREWNKDHMGHIYLTFCDLVVAHYKEERNVNYYATELGYDARYFSKIFRTYNNGVAPLAWIQNYIAFKAKQFMDENPKKTVKEAALAVGFPTTANFCRYFKRATGITPQEYKDRKNCEL